MHLSPVFHLRSTVLAGAFFTQISLSGAADRSITEFNAEENEKLEWRITNDGVMGGLSKGKVAYTDAGTMRFQGNLSLENNGGFSTVRARTSGLDLSDSEGLAMRVKGDGRSYDLRLASDARYRSMEVSFKATFPTTKGEWSEVRVPFSQLEGSWRGRQLKDKVFNPATIQQIGILLGDKKQGPFDLEVDWIRAYSTSGKTVSTSSKVGAKNLVETALADGRFKTLAAALTKAELLNVLEGDSPLTVFAPTDEAFSRLPEGTVESLLQPENREKLQAILKFHVIPGAASLADALKASDVSTVQGETLNIAFRDGKVRVNDATLVNADVKCSNGVIHVIDSVLLPPVPKPVTILAAAKAAGKFDTLLSAIEAAGLTSVLEGDGPFTVLAPTDDAIAALPEETVKSLLKEKNRDQLRAILTYHVVPGRVSAGDALNAGSAKTVNGETVQFGIKDGRFQVNESNIRTVDLACANGVIHIIDAVLLPPKTASTGGDEAKPTVQALITSAIEKGVPLYNSGDAAACAKVYENCLQELVKDKRMNQQVRKVLGEVLDRSKQHTQDADARAWIFRRSLDGAMVYLARAHD